MIYSEKTQKTICELFKDDPKVASDLLNDDPSAIQELAKHNYVDPNYIVDAFNSNNTDELYEKACQLVRKRKLYEIMLEEHFTYYAKNMDSKKKK